LLIASCLIIGVTTLGAVVHVDEYAITPGSTSPIGPRMTLTPSEQRTVGGVSMVDVNISQMTVLSRFVADLTGSPRHFPGSAFGFSGTAGLEKYFLQSYLTMDQAKHDAVIAAFRAAHRPLDSVATGLLIYDAAPSSSLHLGDVVFDVNGHSVHTVCGLARSLNGHGPFSATIRRGHVNPSTGALRLDSPTTINLATMARQPLRAYEGRSCHDAPTTTVGLRSAAVAHFEHSTPSVSFETVRIGGPSAGLSMALALTDQLRHGAVLRGRTVAATGTIDASGAVGDVGGVPEKAVAVGRSHLRWFFVPAAEVSVAQMAAPKGVHVVGVSTLAQAIAALATS
jgi:PDZ domain-containing protein